MSTQLKQAVIDAFRIALRPMVRLLMRSGITWKETAEAVKSVLVDVALKDHGLHGRPTNMSRVSIMTGLSRREVKRLRTLLENTSEVSLDRMNNASRLLTGWHIDPEFLDADGKPVLLHADGPSPNFADLAKKYAGDLAAVTMLRELVRVKAVEQLDDESYRVVKRHYMLAELEPDAVLRSGSVLGDLGATLDHNLYPAKGQDSRFEGRASNLKIKPEHAEEFRDFLEKEAQDLLERTDKWLSDHEAATDDADQDRNIRMGIGIYQIHDDKN